MAEQEARFEALAASKIKNIEIDFDRAVKSGQEFSLADVYAQVEDEFGYDFTQFLRDEIQKYNDKRAAKGLPRIDTYFGKKQEQAKTELLRLPVEERVSEAKKLLMESRRYVHGFVTLGELLKTYASSEGSLHEEIKNLEIQMVKKNSIAKPQMLRDVSVGKIDVTSEDFVDALARARIAVQTMRSFYDSARELYDTHINQTSFSEDRTENSFMREAAKLALTRYDREYAGTEDQIITFVNTINALISSGRVTAEDREASEGLDKDWKNIQKWAEDLSMRTYWPSQSSDQHRIDSKPRMIARAKELMDSYALLITTMRSRDKKVEKPVETPPSTQETVIPRVDAKEPEKKREVQEDLRLKQLELLYARGMKAEDHLTEVEALVRQFEGFRNILKISIQVHTEGGDKKVNRAQIMKEYDQARFQVDTLWNQYDRLYREVYGVSAFE